MGLNEALTQPNCTSGCSTRTVASKLLDTFSVKDFGAIGNGTTDDTVAIQNALQVAALNGKCLLFPQGTYLLSSFSTTGGSTACLITTLTKDIKIIGDNATLKCGSSTQASYMMRINTNGKNCEIHGLKFEGNDKSVVGLFLEENVENVSSAKVSDCYFYNMRYTGTPDWYNEASGLVFYGQWTNVTVDKCFVKNISRANIAGCTVETASPCGSCTGILITPSPTLADPTVYITFKTVTVSNCYIENVTSDITSGSTNVNCDGLKIFGYASNTGATYPRTQVSIYGNHFVNCKGRDIKIQNDESIIQNNTSYMNVLPIFGSGGGSSSCRFNCQITSGIISNNVFHFEQTSNGLSPFAEDGTTTAGSSVISFYDGNADLRSRAITITDNHVYNNVSTAIGILRSVIDTTCGADTYTVPGFITIKNNKVVGNGQIKHFAIISGRSTPDTAPIYYTISDNMVSSVQSSFLANNGRSSYDLTVMSMIGNRHGGSSIPHYTSHTDFTSNLSANISAFNNSNIGTDGTNGDLRRNVPGSFIPRIGILGDPDNANGGTMNVLSKRLADDESYTFPFRGYSSSSSKIAMLVSSGGETTNYIFTTHSNTIVDISKGTSIATNNNNVNPDTDNKVNVWIDNTTTPGTPRLAIKNRLGSQQDFTLFLFG